jgi:hypothetical protein
MSTEHGSTMASLKIVHHESSSGGDSSLSWWVGESRDENGFGIFRYSGNRFRNFSVGFIGNGIFRKRNRFSEFSIGIGIGIGVVFYRPFPSVTGFLSEITGFVSRNFPELCLGIFRNCVSKFSSI